MLSKEEIKKENSEWEKLCNECSNVAKSVGFTKEDTDRIIKETREMQWKAKKYDELIEKLEKDIVNANDNIKHMEEKNILQTIARELAIGMRDYAQEILEIVKGVENE